MDHPARIPRADHGQSAPVAPPPPRWVAVAPLPPGPRSRNQQASVARGLVLLQRLPERCGCPAPGAGRSSLRLALRGEAGVFRPQSLP